MFDQRTEKSLVKISVPNCTQSMPEIISIVFTNMILLSRLQSFLSQNTLLSNHSFLIPVWITHLSQFQTGFVTQMFFCTHNSCSKSRCDQERLGTALLCAPAVTFPESGLPALSHSSPNNVLHGLLECAVHGIIPEIHSETSANTKCDSYSYWTAM